MKIKALVKSTIKHESIRTHKKWANGSNPWNILIKVWNREILIIVIIRPFEGEIIFNRWVLTIKKNIIT